jgi:hypothetical protein
VNAAPSILRVIAPSDRADRRRAAVVIGACAALDAIAAAILLRGTALPPLLEALAAAASHGTAVLLMSTLVRTHPSRRWLGSAAVLAVPCVGTVVATTAFVTRGRGSVATERRRRVRGRRPLTADAARSLGDALATCDALDGDDEERQRAALSTLSRRADSEAIALLRRAASGRDADLALSAALVLDEIGERAERKLGPPGQPEILDGTG